MVFFSLFTYHCHLLIYFKIQSPLETIPNAKIPQFQHAIYQNYVNISLEYLGKVV